MSYPKKFPNIVMIIVLAVLLVGVTGYFGFIRQRGGQNVSIIYRNTEYGFSFKLPISWQGYSLVMSRWQGNAPDGDVIAEGPMISIRHPQWTSQHPRQDIPIMIFSNSQWQALQQGSFHIGAAPINPSELGHTARYVFALPARYNYAFPEGFEEVEKILEGKPLSVSMVPSNSPPIEANIQVSQPVANDLVSSPFTVTGQARVFESQFSYRLRDADGSILAQGSAHADAPDVGQFGAFKIDVTFPKPKGSHGLLEVFDYSARDGSQIDTVAIPLTFLIK